MNKRKAIVIGGGIAGPVVALFLKRAGFDPAIYEARGAAERDAGWFLNLAANGIEVLKTLGIDGPIQEAGSPAPQMVMWSGRGKRLGEVRNGARSGLAESIIIRRSDLQRCLIEAAQQAGIPVYFGKKLTAIDTSGGVTAHFDDGTDAAGDLLIGADGVHSRVRQLINPDAPRPNYTGLISTGGFTRNLDLPPTPNTQHFIFGKRAFFGYHVRSSGEVYWFNNFNQAEEPERSALQAISSDAWRQRLLAMHEGDQPIIRQIIGATDEGIGAFAIYDMPPQPVWYQGPVVLVGDAVHAISPSSGQGASLAMEDAAVLAKSLRDTPDIGMAFAEYEQARRARVERMVAWARSLGSAKLITNPIAVWLRDLLMPIFLKRAANPAALDWVYAYKAGWEQAERAPVPAHAAAFAVE